MVSPRSRIALAFLITRLALVGATFVDWPLARCTEYEVRDDEGRTLSVERVPWKQDAAGGTYYAYPLPWLDAFERMDSEYYLVISAFGYQPGHPKTPGFMPGYPLAVRGLAKAINVVRGDPGAEIWQTPVIARASAFTVSNVALLLAALALFGLAKRYLDEGAAECAAILLLVSPLSFFGSAFLAESLFLWLSVASVGLAANGKTAWASLVAAAAAFTRPVGILLVIPLGLLVLRKREGAAKTVRGLATLILVPLGTVAVFAWHTKTLGEPWAYFRVQRENGHSGVDFTALAGILRIQGKTTIALIRDCLQIVVLASAAFCIVPLVRGAKRRTVPVAFAAWAIVAIVLVVLAGHVISLPRYVFGVAPVFIGAAMLIPASLRRPVWIASTLLQVVGFVVFIRAYPILI